MAQLAILFSANNGVATVILNKPEKCNALDAAMVAELITVFKKIEADNTCRVVILRANGRHFCAGADIGWMEKMAKASVLENKNDARQLADLMQLIYSLAKPVIVLVQGAVMGGGLGLVSVGDMAVAAADAEFTFSEVKLGISPSVISPYVIAAVGERTARYYFLTAEKFQAAEALRMGLVHEVVEGTDLLAAGEVLAEQILKLNPAALAATKKLTQVIAGEGVTDKMIDYTVQHLVDGRASAAGREGLIAFLKRK